MDSVMRFGGPRLAAAVVDAGALRVHPLNRDLTSQVSFGRAASLMFEARESILHVLCAHGGSTPCGA